jgi:GH24 family phage-related lysozyme (muramidase)
MKLNNDGIELIKRFEGLRLKAYVCSGGVVTIGYGTIAYPDGTKVKISDTITKEMANECLMKNLERYVNYVKGANIYSKLSNDNQFSALVSFVYNVGMQGLHKPNSIHRRISNGEAAHVVVSSELPRWNKAGGVVLQGLANRRKAELDLFFKEETDEA